MSKPKRKITKPFWQTLPCPVWCHSGHWDHEDGPDRMHWSSWSGTLTLSLHDALMPFKDRPLDVTPVRLSTFLRQGHRECEPHVSVEQEIGEQGRDFIQMELTLAEAERLAKTLLRAVKLAGGVS
jgi:hypothetical protein